jgi:MoaA/NifB/PqqE/SkfB family radical SAM enzyme
MRTFESASRLWQRAYVVMAAARRLPWMYDGVTPGKLLTVSRAAVAYATKSEVSSKYPAILKVDLSPACNLQCPVCVHAVPGEDAMLARQRFSNEQRMSVAQFARIIDEVSGHTSAASLYYLGDPLMHPDLDAICRVAHAGRVNVHISSNFSFALSDARIRSLLASGVTHITVCLDGLTQETYARTRVGGRLERVLANLERLVRFKAEMSLRLPRVEVQFLRFRHNDHELEKAERLCRELGVDQMTSQWGDVHNYADVDVGSFRVFEPRAEASLPACAWPYVSMVVRYDGDVIPCCEHRLVHQYAEGGDRRPMGNVFRDGVAGVWASETYRRARRIAAAPPRAASRGDMDGHFCEGCAVVHRTDRGAQWRSGQKHDAPLVKLGRKPREVPTPRESA